MNGGSGETLRSIVLRWLMDDLGPATAPARCCGWGRGPWLGQIYQYVKLWRPPDLSAGKPSDPNSDALTCASLFLRGIKDQGKR